MRMLMKFAVLMAMLTMLVSCGYIEDIRKAREYKRQYDEAMKALAEYKVAYDDALMLIETHRAELEAARKTAEEYKTRLEALAIEYDRLKRDYDRYATGVKKMYR